MTKHVRSSEVFTSVKSAGVRDTGHFNPSVDESDEYDTLGGGNLHRPGIELRDLDVEAMKVVHPGRC